MQPAFVISGVLYVLCLIALGWWCRGRIHTAEDYIVAGRRLSLPLSTATLFATWYGAGTLLTAADEVARTGIRVTVMEPYGAAACLLLAGTFYARTLWDRKLFTLQDFFGERFGRTAERVAALYSLGYVGWLATQLVGCAGILNVFADVPLWAGVVLIAVIATAYTLLGGMWSVAITDAFQLVFVILGVVILAIKLLLVGGAETPLPEESLQLLPAAKAEELWKWVGWLLAGSVGILAGQDLFQRVFSARNANTAQRACWAAGGMYAVAGTLPVVIGLMAQTMLSHPEKGQVVARLAQQMLDPWLTVPFMLMVLSVVLSTLDSGLLAPATVLAHNFVAPLLGRRDRTLRYTQLAIVGFGAASTLLALSGERVFEMLEMSYAMGAAPWIVLTAGLWLRSGRWPAVFTLLVGLGAWLMKMTGWEPMVPAIVWVLGAGALAFACDEVLTVARRLLGGRR